MEIILAAIQPKLVEAWRDFFSAEEAQKYHWNINPQGMIWTN